jgi:hypothetical protein
MIKSRMRWAGHVACMEAMKNTQRVFLGKPEEKRLHRMPRYKWEDDI